jgi:hypothetical protein
VTRTERAVSSQVRAMACQAYDIGIRNRVTGVMLNRSWNTQSLLVAVAWLKRMNAIGHDVYLRPCRDDPLSLSWVLVDDLCRDSIEALRAAAIPPSIVLETSPANYQVWVRYTNVVGKDHHRSLATALAVRFNADRRCAQPHHYGRLAGFTNRKPVHETLVGYPFVLLRYAHTHVVAAPAFSPFRGGAPQRPETVAPVPTHSETAIYRRIADRLVATYGSEVDWSRVDWVVAMHFACRRHPPSRIRAVLRSCSPALATRKAGHIDDYVDRTVRKAIERSAATCGTQPEQDLTVRTEPRCHCDSCVVRDAGTDTSPDNGNHRPKPKQQPTPIATGTIGHHSQRSAVTDSHAARKSR